MTAVHVTTPEIRLHCGPTGLNEAVLSLDFLHLSYGSRDTPAEGTGMNKSLLATGGADKEIKLWRVGKDAMSNNMALEFVFSLSGHERSINCVRFSPDGAYLASASDDTSIILWTKPKTAGDDWRWDQISSLSDVNRIILSLGHKGDVTDLSWSPDSSFLCSSSVDNRCVIWNVEKGDVAERRKDHTQYVQGVAWDPLNEYIVTEGNDRTCRVYSLSGFGVANRPSGKKQGRKFACIQTIKTRDFSSNRCETDSNASENKDSSKSEDAEVNAAVEEPKPAAAPKKQRMFLDDTCPAFARRPAWTPDGSYLLAPTGIFRASKSACPVNTVYAFSRGNFSQPTLHLPGQEKASLGVSCSPLLYALRGQEDQIDNLHNLFQMKYRSVFAVITLDAVIIYDTQVTSHISVDTFDGCQQTHPICTIKGLHYADLTDAAWTADGQTLSVSSTDGYISLIQFEDGFFGASIPPKGEFYGRHVALLTYAADACVDLGSLNDEKMRRMFATPTKMRKKARNHAQTQVLPKEQTPTKTSIAKEELKRSLDSSHNSDESITAKPVNLLQVKKKRKVSLTSTPHLPIPATTYSDSICTSATCTSPPSTAQAVNTSSSDTTVVDPPISSELLSSDIKLTRKKSVDSC
ncbi:hypothetical protein PsorP6_009572 [Peronosclerospora sorghi]|uniref:Uncharacterized protein n=1 Tax=Peronosclerospora sorghi TaxID=230839 RepID=A0ACC0W1L2_9STRA|nr:hypothetical protein PsorP6_009572 [Peronosclerospora sorghi]